MIHREGYRIILITSIILLIAGAITFLITENHVIRLTGGIIALLLLLFIMRFFRIPRRKINIEDGYIYSPADGKIVVVEETIENEYFRKPMIQVSVFMSVWNVHINWFPADGQVSMYKYHPGKYLLARHPKSSELNERNSLVLKTRGGNEILLRQIAGYVARRIVSYAREGETIKAGREMGFIKFGSRVDIFLPKGTEILVKPGQKIRGIKDKIAVLS